MAILKKHVSKTVERILQGVIKRIWKGEVKVDMQKYERHRAVRQRAALARKAAKAEEERRQKQVYEDAENEAMNTMSLKERLLQHRTLREEAMRNRREQREEEKRRNKEALKRARALVGKNLRKVPFYKRIKKDFDKREQRQQKERTTKAMHELRARQKPVDFMSLAGSVAEYEAEKARKLKESRRKAKQIERERTQKLKKYFQGEAYQRTANEDNEARRLKAKEELTQFRIDRRRSYGAIVREMFLPKADQAKHAEIYSRIEEKRERENFIAAAKNRSKDMNDRSWRIEDEELRAQERKRIRLKRRKEKKAEEARREKEKSAPDYLREAIATGKKVTRKKKNLSDISGLERNVKRMERALKEKSRAMKRSSNGLDKIKWQEELTELYIRLAKEKVKLYKRLGQESR